MKIKGVATILKEITCDFKDLVIWNLIMFMEVGFIKLLCMLVISLI